MSKVWVVMGSVPWEYQAPIAAFDTEQDAQAFCVKLEARRKRYDKATTRFYDKLTDLQLTMSLDEAYAQAGTSPKAPKHDYPEYYIAEIDFYAKSAP
jgi:hypothetical protein